MRNRPDPFDFPDMPDEAIVAIDDFLSEFQTFFQNYYFAQLHRYYHDEHEENDPLPQLTLPLFDPLSDPPF